MTDDESKKNEGTQTDLIQRLGDKNLNMKSAFDKLSSKILSYEYLLKDGGYAPKCMYFGTENSLLWNVKAHYTEPEQRWRRRLRFQSPELVRPLIECPIKIRLEMERHLETFIKSFLEENHDGNA